MKLAPADIDPHVGVGHHQIGIAGEPKSRDVKQRRQALIGDLDVDMFEVDGVAEVLGGTIEGLVHESGSECECTTIVILGQGNRLFQPFKVPF